MRRHVLLPVVGVATLLAAASAATAAKPSQTVTVFAAASLSDAFREIGKQVEREHPGWRVRFNFAGSNQLALQIDSGAQADVFASADQQWMQYLSERNRLTGAARTFARNRMVVVVPRTNPARIGGLRDLSKPGVKLVLADQAVPAGRYARDVLKRLSEKPDYGENFARQVLANLVSEEESVRAAVTKVELGEADAGFCYVTDAYGSVARSVRTFPIPEDVGVLAEYLIAALQTSRSPDAAQVFIDRVLSAQGQKVLARYGFVEAPSLLDAPVGGGKR